MSVLDIQTAEVFEPLLYPSRYKGAYGGRGSGKSHFFAELMVEDCLRYPGLRCVCIREVQKDLKESAKLLIEDKIRRLGVMALFQIRTDGIVTPGGGIIIFKGMQEYNSESIKSLEQFRRAWIEEAHTISETSLDLLRPTIRADADVDGPMSEIWASWNPRRKTDAIDVFLRQPRPHNAALVQANWRDNPWFPNTLKEERELDETKSPDSYGHKWDGEYVTVQKGAYYAAQIMQAKRDGRIGRVPADPIQALRVFCDLGGSSKTADAFAMWVCQFVGREIRVLDYYEAVGQPAEAHFNWLRDKGYQRAYITLPHDGTQQHGPNTTTWESAFKAAEWSKVEVIKNQGAGAARQRIEAVRRMFSSMWINEATTKPGMDALGWYHEKKDEPRNIGLGPEHDWASHGADAFGLMCIAYDPKPPREPAIEGVFTVQDGDAGTAWMGG